MTSEDIARCKLCGEPMPPGEEMFHYHGYSGPCPKPPLPSTPEGATPGDSAVLLRKRCDKWSEANLCVHCDTDQTIDKLTQFVHEAAAQGEWVSVERSMLERIPRESIAMFQEYRDQYGRDEDDALIAACNEILEGINAYLQGNPLTEPA